MVLQSNFAKRIASNAENTPPASVLPTKSLSSRLRSTLNDGRHRRRARTTASTTTGGNPAKYNAEQAARRKRTKAPAASLRFKMKSIAPHPIADVEMADGESTSTSNNIIPVMLPKELGRPEYCEISREALLAADPELTDVNPVYLREGLEAFGPQLLRTLSSVRASTTTDALPKELNIVVHDLTTALPSHMVAVYGPAPKNPSPSPSTSSSTPAPKRKVTLYPVHSLYLAAHCARLPPFPPTSTSTSTPTVAPGASSVSYTVPVRPLCLPSPGTYPRLSAYLYTKRTDTLLASLLPTPPPASLLQFPSSPSPSPSSSPSPEEQEQEQEHRKHLIPYAHRLAQTYTPQALLQHALLVHGLWQNTCALGIFEDGLWDVIDRAWKVLLCAIALATEVGVDAVLGDDVPQAQQA
ncbi:hypothetical protein D9615_003213 [Tricholomella constricta]|uniref:Clp1-like protein n=1 Tax=Tricholomella constricta TaxID=117010 RepID=A0A8H5HJD1_9AGAR|nr:hypothetical protein D9615_003213 [Tricholomella constricta]